MLELLVIGAGPHALTILSRLLEEAPDDSVDAYRRQVRPKAELRQARKHQATCATRRGRLSAWLQQRVMVVDERGSWMSRWDEQFAGLGIPHLRSPGSVHPDPMSSYALEEWALERRRACELVEMEVMEKSADFRGPFDLPGTRLFADFSRDVVRRYCLDAVLRRAKVQQLTPVLRPDGRPSHTLALLSDGSRVAARRVLVAIGSTNVPRLPPFALGWVTPLAPATIPAPAPTSAPAEDPGPAVIEGSAPACTPTTASASTAAASSPSVPGAPCCAQAPSAAPASPGVAGCAAQPVGPAPPEPEPWAGRMLHAWQVAATFACRNGSASGQHAANVACGGGTAAAKRAVACDIIGGVSSGGGGGPCRSLAGHRVVVIGGGLTAAQLSALAVQHGCTDVIQLVRGELKVKQFDVDTHFLGRMRDAHLHAFSRLRTPQQRLAALRAAVGGGSTTPEAAATLAALAAARRLRLEEGVEVVAADWSDACCTRRRDTSASAGASEGVEGVEGRARGGVLPWAPHRAAGVWHLYLSRPLTAGGRGGGACSLSRAQQPRGGGGAAPQRRWAGVPSATSHAAAAASCSSSPSSDDEAASGDDGSCCSGSGSGDDCEVAAPAEARCCDRGRAQDQAHVTTRRGGWAAAADDDDNESNDDDDEADGGGLLLHADHVWLATGSQVDAAADPLLATLLAACPVPLAGGMPALTPQLRWREDTDIFVAGAYAALQLGPGAANLMGARTAAVRLAALWHKEAGPALCPHPADTRAAVVALSEFQASAALGVGGMQPVKLSKAAGRGAGRGAGKGGRGGKGKGKGRGGGVSVGRGLGAEQAGGEEGAEAGARSGPLCECWVPCA
ncbi:hypothetical protein HYH03_017098 [Edaphochlamys debaryana]|uniref:L-ornithine N(5)-monooxygenase n=1 Tax=Edaphochlamys debaryana TaxID=47281 RepID=A0A835XIJ4_9CHLO|nr:hypothetical protein HYH03_017098 [Edaphochlamys debaryana]|eukprot:KAG2484079.1 hypothetical protein HYH03_017098 [Edaphochlamys debaryana]